MSRGNKGIRDVVKDSRIGGSEVRPPSTGQTTILPYVNGNTNSSIAHRYRQQWKQFVEAKAAKLHGRQ